MPRACEATIQRAATMSGRCPTSSAGRADGSPRCCATRQHRARERRARARALACEGGKLVAGKRDFLVVDVDLALVFRQRRFGLAQVQLRADPAREAPAGQIHDLLLLFERRAGDVEQRETLREPDIGAHHVRLEFELRGARSAARAWAASSARSVAFSSRPQRSRL